MSAGSQHGIEGGIETKDDFEKFIALRVELVKTARLERAIKYDIKCEERQRERWNHELDLARLELYWVQRGLRAGVDTDPEEVLEADIEKFERKLDLSLAKIGESKAQLERSQNDLWQLFDRAWDLESSIDTVQSS